MFRIIGRMFGGMRRIGNAVLHESVPLWDRPGAPGDLPLEQIKRIHDEMTCPYCRSSHGLFEGPRGGASLNLFCGNPDCDSRFNVIDPKFGCVPVGQFLGPCPPDYIERRRKEIRYADETH